MGSSQPPEKTVGGRPGKIEAPLDAKLKAVKWGEFRLTDIFDIKNTHNILADEIKEDSGRTPYLCASACNNAVSTYINYSKNLIEEGNCIFIGGKTFVVTYQEKDFFSNDSHNLVLYLKNTEKRTKPVQLYIVSCILSSLGHKYTWGNSISHKKIQNDFITLPITSKGKIDFAFMESFMRELEEERVRELAAYLTASGLDDTALTASEKAALRQFAKLEWREFRIGDLFEILSYKKRFDANKTTLVEKGGHPYVVRTALNNGQKGFIDEDSAFLNEGNTISFGQDTATMFYQEKPYFTGDKIKIMKPKIEIFDKKIAMYLISNMTKSFSNFSWGSTSFSKETIEVQSVSLPVRNGLPDYAAMRAFISAVQKLVIKDVVAYADREIAATKRVVGNGE